MKYQANNVMKNHTRYQVINVMKYQAIHVMNYQVIKSGYAMPCDVMRQAVTHHEVDDVVLALLLVHALLLHPCPARTLVPVPLQNLPSAGQNHAKGEGRRSLSDFAQTIPCSQSKTQQILAVRHAFSAITNTQFSRSQLHPQFGDKQAGISVVINSVQ